MSVLEKKIKELDLEELAIDHEIKLEDIDNDPDEEFDEDIDDPDDDDEFNRRWYNE